MKVSPKRLAVSLCAATVFVLAGHAHALVVGGVVGEGRSFLCEEQLEGVYSDNWTGKQLNGDGMTNTDVHIRSDGKTVFEGVVTLYCDSGVGSEWKSNDQEAAYTVPEEVVENALWVFCSH